MIGIDEVTAAARRIHGWVRQTPISKMDDGTFPPAAEVWLKLEFMQHSGSFKARGAFNRILSAIEAGELTEEGVVAASGGNAGLAVAFAAQRLGIRAEVFVPQTAPVLKVAKLRALGATVQLAGTEYAEAYEAAMKRVADTGALFCHAYDQPQIVAGQGVLGEEIAAQLPNVDTVLIAVGGGGLLAGVAVALEGRARVVGVEPQTIPTLHAAIAAGEPVDVEVSGIAADSLGARRLGSIAFSVVKRAGVSSVLVPDAAIIETRQMLWDQRRIVVEHGAAAALAALTSGAYQPAAGERICVVLCGANTDPSDLVQAQLR